MDACMTLKCLKICKFGDLEKRWFQKHRFFRKEIQYKTPDLLCFVANPWSFSNSQGLQNEQTFGQWPRFTVDSSTFHLVSNQTHLANELFSIYFLLCLSLERWFLLRRIGALSLCQIEHWLMTQHLCRSDKGLCLGYTDGWMLQGDLRRWCRILTTTA